MNKRNGEIDVLRFLVSIVIVVYHFCGRYGLDKFSIITQGNIGVEFFFVVSGYLMAVHVSKLKEAKGKELADDTWKFVVKKVSVFFRYYLAGVILQLILQRIIIEHKSLLDILRGILQSTPVFTLTTMVLDYIHKSILYLSGSWYLSSMIIASFILYPLLRRYGDVAKKIIFPVISVFLIGYLFGSTNRLNDWETFNGFMYLGTLRGISEMALGASLHGLAQALSKRYDWLLNSNKVFPKLFLTLIKVFCYLIFFMYAKGFNLGKYFSIHALLFVSIGILLSFMGAGYSIPDNKVTRYLGKISLPIYIFHGLLKNVSPNILPLNAGEDGKLLLLAGLTVVLCIVLYKLTDWISIGLNKLFVSLRKKIEE